MNDKKWLNAARDFSVISSEMTGMTGGGAALGYLLVKVFNLGPWVYGITVPVGLFLGIYRISQWTNRKK